mmetsp:Transcript_22625/g.27693  ORF Transcript_22625/g.27693 Transcript_22625/m.27693 type:complete len:192 (+) Transcript_22625:2-577(+)
MNQTQQMNPNPPVNVNVHSRPGHEYPSVDAMNPHVSMMQNVSNPHMNQKRSRRSSVPTANPVDGNYGVPPPGGGLGNAPKQQLSPPSQTGPPGANLFVFNFPRQFTDQDLGREFAHFGNVLSATVFIDKATGRSKCFGFVSYDNVENATHAISVLNGCQMGGKTIKVQLKRESGNGSSGRSNNNKGLHVDV